MTEPRFQAPPLPVNEPERLDALRSLNILDSPPEKEFDTLVQLAKTICDVPIALVSLIDQDRQWFKARCGIDATETERAISFCGHAILQKEIFEVQDARLDERFAENPLVTGAPFIQFYAGVPLVSEHGHCYGTLCIIDAKTRTLEESKRSQLIQLGDLAVHLMNTRRNQLVAEADAAMVDTLLEHMPNAVVACDANGKLNRFNRLARQWHGIDPLEVPPEEWAEHFDLYEPDESTLLPTEKIPLLRAFRGDAVDGSEIVIKPRNERPRHVQCHGRSTYAADGTHVGAVVVMQDFGALKEAVAQSARTSAHLKAIVDASTDTSIIATDKSGLITLFNTGASRLLGYSAEELIGIETPVCFHLASEIEARGEELSARAGRCIDGFDVFVFEALESSCESSNWTYVRKDGAHRQIHLSINALQDGRGEVTGYLAVAVDQTEQLAAQREARLQAERFAGAFDTAAIGMALVSLEGRWTAVNDSLCQMLGYCREELLATDFQTITHPEDLDSDLHLLDQLLAGEIRSYRLIKRYWHKDGSVIWAELSVALVRDEEGAPLHFVSQIRDVTTEKQANFALQASETRLRGLFQLSPIGIALNDAETGDFLDANQALLQQTGYDHSEFIRLSYWDVTPKEYEAKEQVALRELKTLGRYNLFEKEYYRKDGSRYPVRLQGMMIKGIDGRDVIWSLVEDISELQRVERMKADFVSTVSHELRTPLTSISGALQLLSHGIAGPVPDSMQEMLEIAAKNSQRLVLLVNDLLDIDKLAAGKMQLQLAGVDLCALLEETVQSMKAFALPMQVEIALGGDLEGQVYADRARLIQVLHNLLSNACKASPAGSLVELICERTADDAVIIEVIDRGRGIPAAFRPRIFQKFAQGDERDSRAYSGTGLGLAISQQLISHMGGVIGFESMEGHGSRFWIRLPNHSSGSARFRPNGPPRVLHVEDDADLGAVIRTQLRGIAEVEQALTLQQANYRLREKHFDLVLLDLKLPDGSGESLWEVFHQAQPDIPVVVLSGHEVPRALAGRVSAVITKNQEAGDQLTETVRRLIGGIGAAE
ncbi:PAS domain S-box protein [Allohahella marinimesophila]|uniref:histidine kinase n=1 Tax=Allohahella marinimesophila TaxID=1054972 RepID=A0ABP7NYA0_9GAMM